MKISIKEDWFIVQYHEGRTSSTSRVSSFCGQHAVEDYVITEDGSNSKTRNQWSMVNLFADPLSKFFAIADPCKKMSEPERWGWWWWWWGVLGGGGEYTGWGGGGELGWWGSRVVG